MEFALLHGAVQCIVFNLHLEVVFEVGYPTYMILIIIYWKSITFQYMFDSPHVKHNLVSSKVYIPVASRVFKQFKTQNWMDT